MNINDSGTGFRGRQGLGGGITSNPAVTASSDGRVTVPARGNDNGLYLNTVDRLGQASGYIGLGGGFLGSPDAVPAPLEARTFPSGLEAFGRGFDNGLYVIKLVPRGLRGLETAGFVGLGGQLG